MKHTGNRTNCDLYVGNLHFNADCDDLSESISSLFTERIHIENVSIPPGKGDRNRGYGFITLSWARDAPVDPADICIHLSGRIRVNSRRIYLCETNDTNSTSPAASDHSESECDTGDRSESECDTSKHSESSFIKRMKRSVQAHQDELNCYNAMRGDAFGADQLLPDQSEQEGICTSP